MRIVINWAGGLLPLAAPLLIESGFWAARPEAVQIPDQVFEVELVRMQAPPRPPIQPRLSTAVPANVETPALDGGTCWPCAPTYVAASAQTWEGTLLAHLERRKRYPTEARAQQREGVAYVRFVMTRDGRFLSAELERSSGHPALDREAVALLRRAQPLPKPPPDVPGDPVSLSVPVEFFIRR